MQPIVITINGTWLTRLINATREDGMTDEMAWENAQQQTIRIIQKLVERREALASTEEEMIDNVRWNDSDTDGIRAESYEEYSNRIALRNQNRETGSTNTRNETTINNETWQQGIQPIDTNSGTGSYQGTTHHYQNLPIQQTKTRMAQPSIREESNRVVEEEDRLPSNWRERAAQSVRGNRHGLTTGNNNVPPSTPTPRSQWSDRVLRNNQRPTQMVVTETSNYHDEQGSRGNNQRIINQNSAEYRNNPTEYNVLNNGLAVQKSSRQKQMEELERHYLKGNFDKTPKLE